jgi:electron transfer flavoprotein beta subunit
MKILVCIAKVPDTTSKIVFTDNNTKFSNDNVTQIINPTDEWYALVRALEIKEQVVTGSVTVINVGPVDNEQIIRKALAIGADDAVRVNAEDDVEPFFVATQIANYAKTQGYDIIFTGKETINYNSFAIGGMLSELMDLPYISQASKLDIAGNTATINREIEGGEEVLEVNTPFVVAAQKGMAEQRIPNMKGIMSARTKTLTTVESTPVSAYTKVVNYELPAPRTAVKLIDTNDMNALVHLLHTEAKVI